MRSRSHPCCPSCGAWLLKATSCSRCGRDCQDVRQSLAEEAAARFSAGLAELQRREAMRGSGPEWAKLARAFSGDPSDD